MALYFQFKCPLSRRLQIVSILSFGNGLNAIPFNPESSGEQLQDHHGPLVKTI